MLTELKVKPENTSAGYIFTHIQLVNANTLGKK